MSMPAGRRDRRVRLYTKTEMRSAEGGVKEVWTPGAFVWAQKLDLIGKEFWAAAQVNAEITTKFQMLWRQDLATNGAAMRIGYAGVMYDIKSVAEIGRRESLEIQATGRV